MNAASQPEIIGLDVSRNWLDILRSVPEIRPTVLAAILSEAFDSVRKADLQALKCYFGVVTVTKRSGRTVVNRHLIVSPFRHSRLIRSEEWVFGVASRNFRIAGIRRRFDRGLADRRLRRSFQPLGSRRPA